MRRCAASSRGVNWSTGMSRVDHKHEHRGDDDALNRSIDDYQLYIGDGGSNRYSGSSSDMNVAFGRGGNDQLSGSSKDDDLIGGAGNDFLTGGMGADPLVGGAGNDRLMGGDQADMLMGGPGNDILNEGPGHGDLEGGPGNDILTGGLGADAFVISPDSGNDIIKDFRAGPGMFDHIAVMNLEPEQLRFEDTKGGVLISWDTSKGDGSVLLEGVYKNDLAQDDFMFTDERHLLNPVDENAHRVTAEHLGTTGGNEAGPGPTGATTSPSFNSAFDDNNVKFGSDAQNDTLLGTAKNDFYFGLAGNDYLSGGAGDNHLDGGAGNDSLVGGPGQDDLRGGDGNDKLYGGAMGDSLMGGAGNDYLSGGAGHDMLDGGMGNDIYNGGAGADAFIVAHGSGNDVVIGGFDPGPGAFDHIAFTDIMPNEVTVADSASNHGDAHTGVLVAWGDGSIFLEGLAKSQMAQDDFMFNAVEGGAFVPDSQISTEGSRMLFQNGHPDWPMA